MIFSDSLKLVFFYWDEEIHEFLMSEKKLEIQDMLICVKIVMYYLSRVSFAKYSVCPLSLSPESNFK